MSTQTPGRTDKPSLGELVQTLSEKLSQLVRDEIQLARTELTAKAKHAGLGIGLFAGAAFLAFFAFATLVATAVLGLANAVPAWLAALIVAVALLVLAGVLGMVGAKALKRGMPPTPERAQASVKHDIQAIKEGFGS